MNRCFMLVIILTGLFIGMARGQQAKSKFLFRMKSRFEDKKASPREASGVALDDIEMATYHYNS